MTKLQRIMFTHRLHFIDTKSIHMRKRILCLFAVTILGCNFKKSKITEQREKWEFNKWKEQFKDSAFCKCLLAGYGKKEVVDFIHEKDKSYYDLISIAIFETAIDSVLKKEVSIMKSDSILSLKNVVEGGAGKKVFSHYLAFYKSNKLNAIVEAESVKWDTITNIDSIVHKKIPAL